VENVESKSIKIALVLSLLFSTTVVAADGGFYKVYEPKPVSLQFDPRIELMCFIKKDKEVGAFGFKTQSPYRVMMCNSVTSNVVLKPMETLSTANLSRHIEAVSGTRFDLVDIQTIRPQYDRMSGHLLNIRIEYTITKPTTDSKG
jgi:hypothetical protein